LGRKGPLPFAVKRSAAIRQPSQPCYLRLGLIGRYAAHEGLAGLQVCRTHADNNHMATQIFFIAAAVIVGGLAAFALELLLDR